jgi:hypothetical protein
MTATDTLTSSTSLVEDYLDTHPETRHYLHSVLMGTLTSGDDLVDAHLAPMIDSVYRRIRNMVDPGTLTQSQARMYIAELAVFARYNAQFLKLAGDTVAGYSPELAHELPGRGRRAGQGPRALHPVHQGIDSRPRAARQRPCPQ